MSFSAQDGSFKQLTRDYFQELQLSKKQVNKLQGLARSKQFDGSQWAWATAVSCVLAVTVYLAFFAGINYSAISKEIAYNHNSQMQMEVMSSSINDIQKHLNRLDFKLIQSQRLDKEKWELIGGRYCSIDGRIAAQLKVRNRQSLQIHTFYQAKLPEEWLNITKKKELEVDGVKVKVWQEKGLLIGLAI
ncbi:hypothetical protein SNR37_000219 [Agarivorans aestuarii]|uniref:Uncharacterized protein n=1 Tax=Agarivorans aestuarii TaxID=1563703 RepID=A0ABU7G7A9_9ALTE|nr:MULTISPECIES: hypothetical protein [Agarivorans]MEE1674899.1 hypothetical protein [Agarivorans aestuarii]